jgi:Mrp family chromosome partitioning ATPase
VFSPASNSDSHRIVQELGSELAAAGLKTLVVTVDDQAPHSAIPEVSEAIRGTALPSPAETSLATMPAMDLEAKRLEPASLLQVVSRPARQLPSYLRQIRSGYDMVLIGADPLLTSAATEHLVRVADGTVLVAESGKTTKRQLARVAKRLERIKVSGIAIVLTEIRRRRADIEILENVAEYSKA